MPGLLDDGALAAELARADLALVTQSFDGTEFNLPSKLMNFMAQALPVIAAVNPGSEVARLVNESGAGWIADSSRPGAASRNHRRGARRSRRDEEAGRRRAHAYARERFSDESFARELRRAARAGPRAAGPCQAVTRAASSSWIQR